MPTTFNMRTATFHRGEIARLTNENEARRERDVSDVGLSMWAADRLIERHEIALEALAAGDGVNPVAEVYGLWLGDRLVSSESARDQFGKRRWLLTPEQRSEFGRYAIPCGERSRVQRSLGMREERRTVPVQPWFQVIGNGVGGAEFYRFEPI